MGTGSLPGVKRPGRGLYHPSPSSAEGKETVELYLYSRSGTPWNVLGELYLFLCWKLKEEALDRTVGTRFE